MTKHDKKKLNDHTANLAEALRGLIKEVVERNQEKLVEFQDNLLNAMGNMEDRLNKKLDKLDARMDKIEKK